MAAVSTLVKLLDKNELRISSAINGFEDGLVTVPDGLKNAIIDLPSWEPVACKLMLRQILWTQTQLKAELSKLGYDNLISRFMENGYDAS